MIVSVLLGFVLRWFRANYQVPAANGQSKLEKADLKALDKRFGKTHRGILALLLFCVVLIGVGSGALFQWSNLQLAEREGPAKFQLLPSAVIFWLFGLIGAPIVAWPFLELLLPLVLGREPAKLYVQWRNAKAGVNRFRILRWVALVVAGPIFLLTILAVPIHTTFHESEMRVRSYAFSRAKVYRYGEIRGLTVTDGVRNRSGKFMPDPQIMIDFADGTRWKSGDGLRDPDEEIDAGLLAFLERKTGLSAQYRPLERDLTPPDAVPEPFEPVQIAIRNPFDEARDVEVRVGSHDSCDLNRRRFFARSAASREVWKLDFTAPVGDWACVRFRRSGEGWFPWRRESPRWLAGETPKRLEFKLEAVDAGRR